ncbi:hypothetical protein B0H19DRAFT_654840 [Mycena capillaripes]|nr:hypothetical protein B0H19DRAFT_654840 [Mycena capillaripes]
MLTLPGELIDYIIDWSHWQASPMSSSLLATYALVSRQWLPRSRYHHFASIYLIRDRSRDTLKTFFYLVASPLVTFISSVRDVELYHRSSYGTPVLSAGDIITSLWKFGIRPTHLTLNCYFNQIGIHGSQNSFASLTHLGLSLIGDVQLGKLFNNLSAFPSLKSLEFHPSSFLELAQISVQSEDTPTNLPSNLRELVIHLPHVLRSLALLDSSAQFTTLILRQIRHFTDVTQYFHNKTISASLVSLTLDHCIQGIPLLFYH